MTKWVTIIIAANIGVYFLQKTVPGLTEALILVPAQVLQRPWTPFTYMFLHDPNGIGHILFNMLALYFFGPRLETLLGGARFVALYLLSGLGGAALSFLPMYYYAPILGASGAIFGVVTAYARVWPRDRIYIYGILPIQAWWFILLMAGYSIAGGLGLVGQGIAHFGHLGGIFVGYFYMTWLARNSAARRFQRQASVVAPAASDAEALRRWNAIPVDQLHELNRGEVLRLLEKVRAQGARSLSLEERATLDRFSVS
jgi:membrane associated rhomboid family serine protease